MSKFIDAEKLAKAIEDKGLDCSFTLKMERLDTLALIDSLQQEEPDPKELPTLRQAIEEYMYDQIINKIPACPPHSGITVSVTLRPSTVRKLKKDYEQNGIPATAVGTVFTNTDPMNLYVESDKWNALLGQFENGQRVRIIIVKEDEQ